MLVWIRKSLLLSFICLLGILLGYGSISFRMHTDYITYIVSDYLLNIAIIFCCVGIIQIGKYTPDQTNIRMPEKHILIQSFFIFMPLWILTIFIADFIFSMPVSGAVPAHIIVDNPYLKKFDYIVGSIIVCTTSEITFRSVIPAVINRVIPNVIISIIISSTLYSLLWAVSGVDYIVLYFILSILLFGANLPTKSILPSIILRIVTNLYYWY